MIEFSKVEGLSEINRLLDQLPLAMRKKVLNSALGRGRYLLRKELKAAAPTYSGPKTGAYLERKADYGTLEENIKQRTRRRNRGLTVQTVVHTGAAFWGYIQEYGWIHKGGVGPKPWFRPVWDANDERILRRIVKGLQLGLLREAKKLSGRYRDSGLRKVRRKRKR